MSAPDPEWCAWAKRVADAFKEGQSVYSLARVLLTTEPNIEKALRYELERRQAEATKQ